MLCSNGLSPAQMPWSISKKYLGPYQLSLWSCISRWNVFYLRAVTMSSCDDLLGLLAERYCRNLTIIIHISRRLNNLFAFPSVGATGRFVPFRRVSLISFWKAAYGPGRDGLQSIERLWQGMKPAITAQERLSLMEVPVKGSISVNSNLPEWHLYRFCTFGVKHEEGWYQRKCTVWWYMLITWIA